MDDTTNTPNRNETHPTSSCGGQAEADTSEEKRLAVCVTELAASARLLVQTHGPLPISRPDMEAFYGIDMHYDMRGRIDALFSADRDDLVRLVIESGYPIEAPTAFASGSILCGAALIGAARCIRALTSLGADVDALNRHWETPIELACSQAGERDEHIKSVIALVEAGAKTGLTDRKADKERRALSGEVRFSESCTPPTPQQVAARTRPLGREALAALGRDWPDVAAWAQRHGQASSAVPDAARRLRKLRDALGQSDAEFCGGPLGLALAHYELPPAIEAAWLAQEEEQTLSLMGLASGIPKSATRSL